MCSAYFMRYKNCRKYWVSILRHHTILKKFILMLNDGAEGCSLCLLFQYLSVSLSMAWWFSGDVTESNRICRPLRSESGSFQPSEANPTDNPSAVSAYVLISTRCKRTLYQRRNITNPSMLFFMSSAVWGENNQYLLLALPVTGYKASFKRHSWWALLWRVKSFNESVL